METKDVLESLGPLTHRELSEKLGIERANVAAIKSGNRGLSPDAARAAAAITGEKPATLFLVSQVETLKKRVYKGTATPAGILQAAGLVTQKVNSAFAPSEINLSDKDFQRAEIELKGIAIDYLQLAPSSATDDESKVEVEDTSSVIETF